MATYLHGVDSITGVSRNIARIADVLGADPSSAPPSTAMVLRTPASLTSFLRDVGATAGRDVPDGFGTIAGAAAGAYLWNDHRVLGAIGGGSLGRNLPALMLPDQRKLAIRNLATTGTGIAGSLAMPRHPVIGFVVGSVVGGAAAYFGGLK